MTDDLSGFDVLVVGGGNAALAAALSAHENGAKVLILEAAPKCFRAGNSRHTRDPALYAQRADGDQSRGLYRRRVL